MSSVVLHKQLRDLFSSSINHIDQAFHIYNSIFQFEFQSMISLDGESCLLKSNFLLCFVDSIVLSNFSGGELKVP